MINKRTIHMKFINFWRGTTMHPNRFFKGMPYLLDKFNLVPSEVPDFIFSICNTINIPTGNFIRIFFAGENIFPNMSKCDWAFGFHYEDAVKSNYYMRLPNFVRLGAGDNLIKKNIDTKKIIEQKTKFCAYICNHSVPIRNDFFMELSKYKKVDAPGTILQNISPIGGHKSSQESRMAPNFYKEEQDFLKPYKFLICFENESSPGYTSERIYHAMLANCIPIYWGNPLISRDFNTKSFISTYDAEHKNTNNMFRYLIDRVIKIDCNDSLYEKYLKEPWYVNNTLPDYLNPKRILDRFTHIFSNR